MDALRQICSCPSPTPSRLSGIQEILGRDILNYGNAVERLLKPDASANEIALFGCFAARKLLEAGCVALLARFDPSRLLILREFQIKGKYALTSRHQASIDWSGDVVSEGRASWADTTSPSKFVRSLLGGHLAEVVWHEAISKFAQPEDPTLDTGGSAWLEELLTQHQTRAARRAQGKQKSQDARGTPGPTAQPEPAHDSVEAELLASFRTNAQQNFSTLSKGVHLEFVVDQSAILDVPTVQATMRRTVKLLTQLAYISHFADCGYSALPIRDALPLVRQIEDEIEQ